MAALTQLDFYRTKSSDGSVKPSQPVGLLGCILDYSFLGDEVEVDRPGSKVGSRLGSRPASRKNTNSSAVSHTSGGSNASFLSYRRLGSILPTGSTHALDNDSRQPLLERHFAELLVRCIAQYAAHTGQDCQGIYYAVFRVLAEKFEPFCADKRPSTSDFIHGFYSDSVQDCLRSFSLPNAALYRIWNRLNEIARKGGAPEATTGLIWFCRSVDQPEVLIVVLFDRANYSREGSCPATF
jgi:hypothetical protein